MKKILTTVMAGALLAGALASCNGEADNSSNGSKAAEFDPSTSISIISREDGSGTRGAFIELFEIEEKGADGKKVDKTSVEANITQNTSVMLTTVEGNKYAIGYVSLGSLKDSVKALKIDGVAPSAQAVKDDSYKISRPFNIVTKDGVSEVSKDFIAFIMSADGQKIVEDAGYIPVSEAAAYSGSKPSGTVKVSGSSSVTPVMEKLKEAYEKVNTGAKVEIQQSDSTNGVNDAVNGISDIGMASRNIKDTELAKGIKPTVIAKDGIAVIANKANTADDFTKEQIKSIFTGEKTKWSDVIDAE